MWPHLLHSSFCLHTLSCFLPFLPASPVTVQPFRSFSRKHQYSAAGHKALACLFPHSLLLSAVFFHWPCFSALPACTWEFADTRYSASPQEWSEHASSWKPQTLGAVGVHHAYEIIKCVRLHMHSWLCLVLAEISLKICFLSVFWPKYWPFSIFHVISPIPNFRFRQYIWCFIFSALVLHLNFLRLLSASCTVHKRFLQLNGFFLLMHIKHGCS